MESYPGLSGHIILNGIYFYKRKAKADLTKTKELK